MEHFDRVLCSEPDNLEVRRLLQRIGRRQSTLRVARVTVAALLIAGLVGSGAYGAVHFVQQAPKPRSRSDAVPPQDGAGDRAATGDSRLTTTDGQTVIADARGSTDRRPIADDRSPTTDDRRLAADRAAKADDHKPKSDDKQPVVGTVISDAKQPEPPPEQRAHPPQHREVRFNAVNVVTAYVDDNAEPVVHDRIGPFSLDLTYATHRLRFTNPLAYDSEMSLTVDGTNPAQLVVVRLQPLPAKLFIDRAPDGATVEVGGRTWLVNAQTRNEPIFVALPLGAGSQSMEVVVRRGDLEYRRTVEFKPGQERRLDVQLDHL